MIKDCATEKIICAAVWIDDGEVHVHQPENIRTGFVIGGRRHHNCLHVASLIPTCKPEAVDRKNSQGFLTSWDRYVLRPEAMIIARREGQLIDPTNMSDRLYSEDLY